MRGEDGFDWYTKLPSSMAGTQQTPSASLHLVVEEDKPFLRVTPDADNVNWTLSTVDPESGNGVVWQYGYFEAKMRFVQIPRVTNWSNLPSWASFWLTSPVAWQGPAGTKFSEIDIFEQLAGPNVLSATVHEWSQNQPDGHLYTKHEKSVNMEGWHTYGLLWEKGKLSWFFDDSFVMSCVYGEDVEPTKGVFTQWADKDGVSVDTLPKGTFSSLDTQPLTLVLGTGISSPVDVEFIRVWT